MQPYVVVLHVQVFACSMMMYHMAGNFGGEFILADWRF